MRREVRGPGSRDLDAAELASRSAVLLRGGVPAGRALQLAAREMTAAATKTAARAADEVSQRTALLTELHDRIDGGVSVAEALCASSSAPEWRLLAAAWFLAERSGAPLAPALDRIAGALQSLEQLHERRESLLAGPRMTVRLVASLPPLALLLGALLGFNPIPVLVGPVGIALLVIGSGLLAAGIAWARALNHAVENRDRVAGLELELAWIAMSSGAAPSEAMLRVTDCVSDFGVTWVRFDDLCEGRALRSTLNAAQRVGVPSGPLLLEAASDVRARALAELESDAERLGVRVLVPLGVCVLPAFIALGVLPVLFSMLGGLE